MMWTHSLDYCCEGGQDPINAIKHKFLNLSPHHIRIHQAHQSAKEHFPWGCDTLHKSPSIHAAYPDPNQKYHSLLFYLEAAGATSKATSPSLSLSLASQTTLVTFDIELNWKQGHLLCSCVWMCQGCQNSGHGFLLFWYVILRWLCHHCEYIFMLLVHKTVWQVFSNIFTFPNNNTGLQSL